MSILISFSKEELLDCLRIAHRRNDDKIKKVKNRRVDKNQTDLAMNFNAIRSERATYNFLKVPLTEGPFYEVNLSGDAGHDVPYKGYNIQVKYNTYDYGDFYLNSINDFKSDIGVLVVKDKDKYSIKIIGWIWKKEFIKHHEIKNFGYGSRVCISQNQLEPMTTIKEINKEVKDTGKFF